ncbi:MAG: ribosome biogenesis GTPase Der [Bacteroidota bacterium]
MGNIVAIIGAPNVGKSTLFNRITEKKKAIVDDMPGVTRDRCYEVADWCGHSFTLIDTGGYINYDVSTMQQVIDEQVKLAIQEAQVILLVVDSQRGVTSADREIVKLLQNQGKPVLVVANKSDDHAFILKAYEFHTFGIGSVYPISATHGSGTGDMLDALVALFPEEEKEDKQNIPKIALIGRPNQGKSTFLNKVLGENRSIVSDQPNTTRTPINSHYRLYNKHLIFIDTAGIRKKNQVNSKSVEFYALIRSIRVIEEADVCIMFIDAEEGLTKQDQSIMSLVQRRKKGLVLLVNKWDKMKEKGITIPDYKQSIMRQLAYMNHVPILCISGLYKKGIYQAIEKAMEVYQTAHKKFSTHELNNVLIRAINRQPPPTVKGKSIKIKYMVQLPNKNPTFAFFCNFPQYIPSNYKRYIENQMRIYFHLNGAPLTLLFKKK